MWFIHTVLRNRKLGLLDCCNEVLVDCNIDVVCNIEDNKIIAHKEEPLTLLVHWADYWTAHIYEEGRDKEVIYREGM